MSLLSYCLYFYFGLCSRRLSTGPYLLSMIIVIYLPLSDLIILIRGVGSDITEVHPNTASPHSSVQLAAGIVLQYKERQQSRL